MTDKPDIKENEYDDNKRNLKGIFLKFAGTIAFIASVYHLYSALGTPFFALTHRAVHLGILLFIGFFYYSFSSKNKDTVKWYDILTALLSVFAVSYVIINVDQLVYRAGDPATADWIIGILMTVLVLEMTRRTVGNALVIIAVMFLIYAYFGPYMPGMLIHRGYSPERIFSYLFMSLDGIFGVPVGVSADFIFLFIIFGTFLEKSGAGEYFIDLAYSVTGKTRGGPAKASVLASGLLGSISGSSVANAVTSGTFTIPLMKKIGYSGKFSAGVEAAASTGGQLMPPIMGAAAFIMAEFIGVEFSTIALSALIPAILYFVSLIAMVHFRAVRAGIKKEEDVPKFFETFIKRVHLLIPIGFLVAMLFLGFSPQRSVGYSILIIIFIMAAESIYRNIIKNKNRSTEEIMKALKSFSENLYYGFRDGAVKTVQVACACASAGIIVGIVTMTGLGLKLAGYIEVFSGERLFLGLIITMIASLILGIGLPTTAKYIVLATLVGPALERLGVGSVIAAHLFIFYFAIYADITPPVSLTAYATAGIGDAKPVGTSIEAFKLGLSAVIIPYIFVYSPALILEGNIPEIIITVSTAFAGIVAFSGAIQGAFFKKINVFIRAASLISGTLLLFPGIFTDISGIIILGGIFAYLKFFEK